MQMRDQEHAPNVYGDQSPEGPVEGTHTMNSEPDLLKSQEDKQRDTGFEDSRFQEAARPRTPPRITNIRKKLRPPPTISNLSQPQPDVRVQFWQQTLGMLLAPCSQSIDGKHYYTVTGAVPGSEAESLSDIVPGLLLKEVNGENVAGMPMDQLAIRLGTKAGRPLQVTLMEEPPLSRRPMTPNRQPSLLPASITRVHRLV
jgi:hypothetical protein